MTILSKIKKFFSILFFGDNEIHPFYPELYQPYKEDIKKARKKATTRKKPKPMAVYKKRKPAKNKKPVKVKA